MPGGSGLRTGSILQLAAGIDALPTAVIVVDSGGRIAVANTQAERLFGYAEGMLPGTSVDELVPPRFGADHARLRASFLRDPQARPMGAGRDLFARRRDGTEFPVEIGLNPVNTDDGPFVLGAIVDISERIRQAEALRLANEALERSNIELQRFAYVASHDLQTPMRGIASFAQLLQRNYAAGLDPQAADWIRRIVESVAHLQSLVRDLLEYSRIDSQAHPFRPVALDEVVDDAVNLLDASVREAGAEIHREALPVLAGDRSQLVQLLLNLLGNALKYRSTAPPRIHVSAARQGTDWQISVRDNGIGIAAAHQERIFEIFQRLHDQQEYPGTGIGLAVCRRVVHRHGGRIWVESAPDAGSVFHFTIPDRGEETG